MALWVLFYAVFVVYVFWKLDAAPGFKFYLYEFPRINLLLWRSVMGYAWLALTYWMVMYYLLPVRAGRFRLFIALFLPMGVTIIIFLLQWHAGGAGAASDKTILSQPGVTKRLDFGEVHRALIKDYPDNLRYLVPHGSGQKTRGNIRASDKVREVFFDQARNALFCFYGGTYYFYGTTTIPAVVKKDLDSGKISYLLTEHNVRRVEMTQKQFFRRALARQPCL